MKQILKPVNIVYQTYTVQFRKHAQWIPLFGGENIELDWEMDCSHMQRYAIAYAGQCSRNACDG